MSNELVLVVEDNQDLRRFVRQVLEEYGLRVIDAYSGWRALQLAETCRPDVLVLDWQLPDITGLDVLRALRAGGCLAPAILMTAYSSEDLAIFALHLGVHYYLRKPFAPDDLTQAVDSALELPRLRREYEMLAKELAKTHQALNDYVQYSAPLAPLLQKLAFAVQELRHERPENWRTRVDEAMQLIKHLAQAVEHIRQIGGAGQ